MTKVVLAAKKLNRNSVGYEMNLEFIPFIKKKLEINQSDIFNSNYEFISQNGIITDYKNVYALLNIAGIWQKCLPLKT